MSDLIERINKAVQWQHQWDDDDTIKTLGDARVEIERLEAENARLREALAFYADDLNYRMNAALDPNAGRFEGSNRAIAALAVGANVGVPPGEPASPRYFSRG